MPLPPPTVPRVLSHTRRVRFEAFRREDGLWDIEGHLTDIKPKDTALVSGVRAAGMPMHDMWVRLTIDGDLNVVDAVAVTDAMPYTDVCADITPRYGAVVGLNLGRGFRRAVQERFAGVAGCTHLTEMLAQFPTAAIQTLAGERRDTADESKRPFQLDRCHALDTTGDAVERYYPRWHVKAKRSAGA